MANEDFVNFENALRELKLNEDQLKRLVSEGEIRAIRGENNSMKFRKEEIERLKQDTGKTIQYTEESSDTLTDDLLFDEADDLDVDEEGMATAQISSDDTFVGDDIAADIEDDGLERADFGLDAGKQFDHLIFVAGVDAMGMDPPAHCFDLGDQGRELIAVAAAGTDDEPLTGEAPRNRRPKVIPGPDDKGHLDRVSGRLGRQ